MNEASWPTVLQRTAIEAGRVLDRLVLLAGGEGAYRRADRQDVATALMAEQVELFERTDFATLAVALRIAVARLAPHQNLCDGCGRITADSTVCEACLYAPPDTLRVPPAVALELGQPPAGAGER